MRRRGFTLIEVLAVLVVLGVISLIAVPITLNLINESRINSFKSSTDGMIKSIEMYYVKSAGDDLTLNLGNDEVMNALDFTGKKPTAGYAYITREGIISILMYNENFVSYRKYGEEEVTVLDRDECTTCPSQMATDEEKDAFLKIPK